MRKFYYTLNILFLLTLVLLVSCKENKTTRTTTEQDAKPRKTVEYKKPASSVSFHFEKTKEWLEANKSDSTKLAIAYSINRTDKANFAKMDSVIIPSDFTGELPYYLPFPIHVSNLADVSKVLVFSYPTQTFAAYENGELVYTGPTNMGRKKTRHQPDYFLRIGKPKKQPVHLTMNGI